MVESIKPVIIMENIVIGWFMRFGTPVSFLDDVEGQFNNDFGCLAKSTAGYATFSNGLVEKENGIIKGMLKQSLHMP